MMVLSVTVMRGEQSAYRARHGIQPDQERYRPMEQIGDRLHWAKALATIPQHPDRRISRPPVVRWGGVSALTGATARIVLVVLGLLVVVTYLLLRGAAPDAALHERRLRAIDALILHHAALDRDCCGRAIGCFSTRILSSQR